MKDINGNILKTTFCVYNYQDELLDLSFSSSMKENGSLCKTSTISIIFCNGGGGDGGGGGGRGLYRCASRFTAVQRNNVLCTPFTSYVSANREGNAERQRLRKK